MAVTGYGTWDAVSPEFMKKMKGYWNQREATTGKPPDPNDIQALAEAQLNVNAMERRRDLDFEQRKKEFATTSDIQREALNAQKRAATVSGITQLGTLAGVGYKAGVFDPLINAAKGIGGGVGTTTATALPPSAFAAGTAGEGMAEGAGAAGILGPEGAGLTVGSATGVGLAGQGGYLLGSQFGGGRGKEVAGITGSTAAGAAAGTWLFPGVGTFVGAGIGFVVGGFNKLRKGTVICTELYRQGKISNAEYTWCKVFKMEHVSHSTFIGYMTWAPPVVRQMEKGGWFNRLTLPLTTRLVHQWVNIAKGKKGSLSERAVYRVAYWTSRVAYHWATRGELLGVRAA